jgi:hypothetical protein
MLVLYSECVTVGIDVKFTRRMRHLNIRPASGETREFYLERQQHALPGRDSLSGMLDLFVNFTSSVNNTHYLVGIP